MRKVCGHYVLVKPDEIVKKSKGGILLAEEFDTNKAARAEAASTTGVVVDIGRMAWKAYDGHDPDWQPWCHVGNRIVYPRHVGKIYEDHTDLDSDGNPRKLFIIADENVLMVIPKEADQEEIA